MLKRFAWLTLFISLAFAPQVCADDFTPPKDGVFTEKQLTDSIDVTKDWMATMQSTGKALHGNQSAGLALAALANTDQKFKDSLVKHDLSQGEYDWVTKQMWDAYSTLLQVDTFNGDQAQKDFAAQLQKHTDALAAANKKLTDDQAAQKSGKKILTADERQSIIDNAKSDEQSGADDLKTHTDEAKQAQDAIDKAKTDEATAEKLAQNPPSDVSADDRDQYIKDRQSDADTAKQAIKDATDQLNQANDAIKTSQTQIAADKAKEQNPDVPTTDDDKSAASKTADDAIAADKDQIDQETSAIKTLNDSHATAQKMAADAAAKTPAQNLDLIRKHRQDFEAIFAQKK